MVRRSSWLECLLYDRETDLGHGPSERPFMADSGRCSSIKSSDDSGSDDPLRTHG
jgi:hypothetical protein